MNRVSPGLPRPLIVIGVATAALAAGCGSTKVVTRTTIVEQKTVTVEKQAPAPASTTPATTPAPAALPALIVGSFSGMKPVTIDFSGDAGNVVTAIAWSSWTGTGAVGEGMSNIQGCIPNCAQGSETAVATAIELSDPQGGHFTQMTETRQGRSTSVSYPSQGWPISAS